MPITAKPVVSLIQSYGVAITHRPAVAASPVTPWKTTAAVSAPVVLKGLVHRIRSDQNPDLPEGRLKAVMVLLVRSGETLPRPGDGLAHDGQSWRISTILPLISDRRHTLIEALVTSGGVSGGISEVGADDG
ncbi:MAG: hypothetical protein J4F41_09465 [Alphaproteobacteria bacterium]|nr:hypothetical protein [Alphaproteobacteria bacterium]